MKDAQKFWEDKANILLLGRRIVKVYWMSEKEAKQCHWNKRPLIFHLDDGSRIIPQCDDEGNDGGALWVGSKDGEEEVLPVF